ncbi:MAG TPA: hypothetical protein VF173_11400 [Thermoanaerobaculia bacterium]|nr:hypothetical protein [Thermoanaerobaculia bacterium]
MRRLRFGFLALLALVAAAAFAASGYIVYMKDGTSITAKEKYKVDKDRALITLPNGQQTFILLSLIDVAKSDRLNRDGYGSAVVLPSAPQETPATGKATKDRTLSDLINSRAAAPRDLPTSRRDKNAPVPGRLVKTRAGFNDLSTLPQKPYSHSDVAAELQQAFHAQGLDEVEIYEGTQSDRPFLAVTTNSEGSVFKALSAAANALLRVRDQFPGKVSALELLMTVPSRERAGQFVLTPDQATELAAKKTDVAAFFVRNVQF